MENHENSHDVIQFFQFRDVDQTWSECFFQHLHETLGN